MHPCLASGYSSLNQDKYIDRRSVETVYSAKFMKYIFKLLNSYGIELIIVALSYIPSFIELWLEDKHIYIKILCSFIGILYFGNCIRGVLIKNIMLLKLCLYIHLFLITPLETYFYFIYAKTNEIFSCPSDTVSFVLWGVLVNLAFFRALSILESN